VVGTDDRPASRQTATNVSCKTSSTTSRSAPRRQCPGTRLVRQLGRITEAVKDRMARRELLAQPVRAGRLGRHRLTAGQIRLVLGGIDESRV
jgi:hypothetical protein